MASKLLHLVLAVALVAMVTADSQSLLWRRHNDADEVESEVSGNEPSAQLDEQWNSFKMDHGKVYAHSSEEAERKQIFAENLKKIEAHNDLFYKGMKSFTLGINQFADLELSEFVARMNGLKKGDSSRQSEDRVTYLSPNIDLELPDMVDWRTKGYVTPVKDQGSCGSCWAFSTTGALEGQHFRATKKLVSLSEQNLVDCSQKQGNLGCSGGWPQWAFEYVKANKGIDTEESYPYEGVDGQCRFKRSGVGATCSGYVEIPEGDESKLQEAVATVGPVSVAIDAGHASFQLYKTGIYDEPDCKPDELDHAVLAVGYGSQNGKDYWLVKNSWSITWGTQGYIMMSRNKDNQCGIATNASYPLV